MRRAFTLIELLVVIGIIALLVSILLPVLSKAKARADRVACSAHLRDIGASFQMYLNDSKGKLPLVNTMPSLKPPVNAGPSLPKLLEPYVKTATGVFRCRSDSITEDSSSATSGLQTYFDREGSSYQYNPMLSILAGQRLQDSPLYQLGKQTLLPIVSDYEPFHGKKGQAGASNHLFADMHVSDFGS